jgi:branched-chain amino acid transport system substrate-binding protein
MSQKNDTPVLVLALLITLGLLGGGAWWFLSQFNMGNVTPTETTSGTSENNNGSPTASPQTLRSRLSSGNTLLVTDGATAQKQAGVQAFAAGNFDQAVTDLQASLQASRNDPEALIYLNNARIGTATSYAIAVSVPVANSLNPALEILRGVAQAQDEINQAGGINGVPLKVLIVSDDNDPAVCQEVANALVQEQAVLGVIGHFGSDATLAAAPIYQQGKLVMISPTSTSIQLSGLGSYVFRTVPSDRFTATTLARYMLNTLQKQNAAIFFNSQSSYSQSLKDEFTTALYSEGGQIVSEFDVGGGSFDANAAIAQAKQQNAQVLVLASNTATLDQALQVVAVNRRELALMGGDSLYNPKLLQVGGESAVDMVVAVPWIFLSNPQSPFAQDSRQLWGGDVNWRTAMAYDAAQVLIAAIKQNPSREGVEQVLHTPNFSVDGATGVVKFLPSGDRNQAMQLVVVQSGNRSGFGYDFVPVP